MFQIFEFPVTIREHHLDTFGHVNNAAYLEIFEEARWDFIYSRGFGISDIQKTGIGPTILEINIRFLKELKLRQAVIVKSQSESYTGRIGILKQWMESPEGLVFCEAQLKIGLFDTRIRKLISPTPEWLKAVGESE